MVGNIDVSWKQKLGIPRYANTKSVFGNSVPNFLAISCYFFRYLEYDLLKIWLNVGIFWQNENSFSLDYCGCHYLGVDFVSVCNFFLKMTSLVGKNKRKRKAGFIYCTRNKR